MAASNVLIVGMKGLGVEIGELLIVQTPSNNAIINSGYKAKNLVLAGVKSVTIFDPEPVKVRDLGTQVSLIHQSWRGLSRFQVFPARKRHWPTTRGGDRASSRRA